MLILHFQEKRETPCSVIGKSSIILVKKLIILGGKPCSGILVESLHSFSGQFSDILVETLVVPSLVEDLETLLVKNIVVTSR